MGCPEPRWAFATKHTPYPQQGETEPAEDYLSGLVGLAGGATIQVDCSRMLQADASNVFEVYGTDGAVSDRSVTRYDRDEETFGETPVTAEADVEHTAPPERPDDDPCYFYHEVEHFAMAVAGEVDPDVDATDASRFMTILDALYESARENEKVVVD
jgi:predicted dehydrogenase